MSMIARPPLTEVVEYVVAQPNDVKCGRGRVCFNHPGNRLLRLRVAIKLEEYRTQASRTLKTKVIEDIIDEFYAQGERFLKFDRSVEMWYDGGIKAAKERIGSAFRDASQPNKVKCMEKLKSDIINEDQADDLLDSYLTMSIEARSPASGSSEDAVRAEARSTETFGPMKIFPSSSAHDLRVQHLPAVSHDEDSQPTIELWDDEDSKPTIEHWDTFSLRYALSLDEVNWSAQSDLTNDVDYFDEETLKETFVGDPEHFTRTDKAFLAALDWTKLTSCMA